MAHHFLEANSSRRQPAGNSDIRSILGLVFAIVMCSFFSDVKSLSMGWGLNVFSYNH